MTENIEDSTGFGARVEGIALFQKEVLEKLQGIETELGGWFSELCAANNTLGEKLKTVSGEKGEGGS